jgi:hypothetical protein
LSEDGDPLVIVKYDPLLVVGEILDQRELEAAARSLLVVFSGGSFKGGVDRWSLTRI